jgi:integrase
LPYHDWPLRKELKKARKEAEIENFDFHFCRHHVGSWLAMKEVALDARMALLGHKTVKMARQYSHLSPDFLREAIDFFPEKLAQTNSRFRYDSDTNR